MPELNAEQRLRDDAIVRGIIAQAQREAAQAVLDAVETIYTSESARLPYRDAAGLVGNWLGGIAEGLDAARVAAARYGAGTTAGGDGR